MVSPPFQENEIIFPVYVGILMPDCAVFMEKDKVPDISSVDVPECAPAASARRGATVDSIARVVYTDLKGNRNFPACPTGKKSECGW
jgi:hypothetical protein